MRSLMLVEYLCRNNVGTVTGSELHEDKRLYCNFNIFYIYLNCVMYFVINEKH